jgi:hypothetical protein
MKKRPWLIVVFAFALLIAAWSVLIYIAVKNTPETIPLETERSENAS